MLFLADLSPSQVEAWLAERGQPAYRARQVLDWLYRRWAGAFADMTDLPAGLRTQLAEGVQLSSLCRLREQQDAEGTRKFLFGLADGQRIETVLIRAPGRQTVCVSTQVGCPVRCTFCASGRDGWQRDLGAAEIVDQVLSVCRELGQRVSHVVVMGMGEPLLNLEHLIPALDALCDPLRLGLGARHVTVSTSGIVPGIRRLADEGRQWNLALSLHAPSDAGRQRLIPAAHRYPLAEVLAACRYYEQRTGRMVTLEYALMAGVNDGAEEGEALARLARELHAKVNLIPYNATGARYAAPALRGADRFLAGLRARGVQATLRREKGSGIGAACGQLRGAEAPVQLP